MSKFFSYRDLRNAPAAVWEALSKYGAVAILSNGTPRAIMLDVEDGDVEGTLELVRRVRAHRALTRLRAESARRGADQLSESDVDAEILAVRRGRPKR